MRLPPTSATTPNASAAAARASASGSILSRARKTSARVAAITISTAMSSTTTACCTDDASASATTGTPLTMYCWPFCILKNLSFVVFSIRPMALRRCLSDRPGLRRTCTSAASGLGTR